MKKFRLLAFASLFSTIALFSCDKEQSVEPTSSTFSEDIVYIDGYRLNNQSITDLTNLSENEEDKKINELSLKLSLALKPLIKQEKYSSFILDKAEASPVNGTLLTELISEFPDIKVQINKYLEKSNTNLNELVEAIKYKDVKYSPILHIPNAKAMDKNILPLFSSGLAVSSNEDRSLEDYVMSWYLDEDGEEHEVVVGETHLDNNTPLIILGIFPNEDIQMLTDPRATIITSSSDNIMDNSKGYRNTNRVYSNEFRLDERFESNGDSEFNFMILGLNPDGMSEFVWGGDNNAQGRIASVDKDDIGSNLNHWKFWFNEPTSPRQYVFNTFEEDWFRAPKELGKVTKIDGSVVYMLATRRYKTDCYWEDDIETNNLTKQIDYTTIFTNWALFHHGDNGYIRLWKVVN